MNSALDVHRLHFAFTITFHYIAALRILRAWYCTAFLPSSWASAHLRKNKGVRMPRLSNSSTFTVNLQHGFSAAMQPRERLPPDSARRRDS